MKQFYLFVVSLLTISAVAAPVKFAVLTDSRVSAPEIVFDTIQTQDSLTLRDTTILVPREVPGEALQALQLCTEDLRSEKPDFILYAGNMTEDGDSLSLVCVRELLKATELPYYITTGDHETMHSPSALQDLRAVFDSTRFVINTGDLLLLGLNSGAIMHPADGHIAAADTSWAKLWLDSLGTQPTIVLTHRALKEGDVDNWYDLTGLLRQYNTQVVIGGSNESKQISADGIDNVFCRSTLPDEEGRVGYTLVEVDDANIRFSERVLPGVNAAPSNWIGSIKPLFTLPLKRREFAEPDTTLLPSYAVNDSDSLVVRAWSRQLPVSFYATPTERYGRIYIGDDNGTFYAIDVTNGRILWRYKTNRRIVGSADMKDGKVVFGCANGTIYCLSVETGKPIWRQKLGKPITGSVTIDGGAVYVGSSDSCFYALHLGTGAPIWTYRGLGNYCIARPLVVKNRVYVGAWDGNFYAFDKRKGKLLWRWNNDSIDNHLSPAAVTPCADKRRVYIVAPDHYLTALNVDSGRVSRRTDRWQVNESLGIKDSILYAKTLQDTIIAINLNADTLLWATDAGYGFDPSSTQLMVNEGILYVTTKNGLIIALDALTGEIEWKHKLGNSRLTTACPIEKKDVVVASSDGTIAMLRLRDPILPDTLAVDSLMLDSLQMDSLSYPIEVQEPLSNDSVAEPTAAEPAAAAPIE